MKIIPIVTSIFIHTKTQDIVKHRAKFKQENSLLKGHKAWKIFMKLDPIPFETFFQQVMRLEKNTNELKESVLFLFLRSDKGLQSSKEAQ